MGLCHYCDDVPSLSARRAWIEIVTRYRPTPKPVVALRKESVDRNKKFVNERCKLRRVALRKESVDRNKTLIVLTEQLNRSLSARRAWIEI